MNYEIYFKDFFESITDFRKVVLILIQIKDDKILIKEVGFSKKDMNQLPLEFKIMLLEQHEIYLEYVKDQEESIIERILNR